jgi:hypothetical protein
LSRLLHEANLKLDEAGETFLTSVQRMTVNQESGLSQETSNPVGKTVADHLKAIVATVTELQPYQELVETCTKCRQAFEEELEHPEFDEFMHEFVVLFRKRISSQQCAWSAEAVQVIHARFIEVSIGTFNLRPDSTR